MQRKHWLAMEALGVFVVLLVLGIWFLFRVAPESEALRGALGKVPLPPGLNSFVINGDDLESDFYVRAECPTHTMEELLSFYRDHFAKNGWTDDFGGEPMSEGLLHYSKGRTNMSVTVVNVGGPLQLMVSYHEYPYTHGEFEELRSSSATPEAMALVGRIQDTYRNLDSYTDHGTFTIHEGRRLTHKAVMDLRYDESGDILFQYQELDPTFNRGANVLWKSGPTVRTMSDYDTAPTDEEDLEMAIASLTGVTRGTVGNILELLVADGEQSPFRLAHLAVLADVTMDDGILCHRLHGTDFFDGECTLWIGRDDLLLRKIEVLSTAGERETTEYFPRPNVDIPPEELAFREPVLE